jgi:endonuclease/exonuclease/phosphatase family metal-dependent hydrolase
MRRRGSRDRLAALAVAAAMWTAGLVAAAPAQAAPSTVRLRLMTFNIEYGGTVVDFDRIVEAVVAADADVVGVNESYSHLPKLARAAGYDYWDTRLDVISRFPLMDPSGARGRYVFVELAPGQVIALSNVHLPSSPYGPRRILVGWKRSRVLELERTLRVPPLRPYVQALRPVASSGIPAFLMGDMNSPSSQDYTRKTVGSAPQHRWPVAWPVTELLLRRGFLDTYRETVPNPLRHPGLTWPAARPRSPDSWNPLPDAPKDRIDQIWMAGPAAAVASQIVGEAGGRGVSIHVSPWGSDHRAVVSTVDVTPGTPPVMVAASARLLDVGDDLTVRYHAPGAAGEKVVLVPAGGDPATDAVDSAPTPGGQPIDGSVTFPALALVPGSYEAVLVDASDMRLARARFWVRTPGSPPVLSTSRHAYDVGEPIVVTWTLAPGNRFDWLGVYHRHADPHVAYYRGYVYAGARVEGRARYDAHAVGTWPLKPGRYTVYYLVNDSYRQIASADFTVRG